MASTHPLGQLVRCDQMRLCTNVRTLAGMPRATRDRQQESASRSRSALEEALAKLLRHGFARADGGDGYELALDEARWAAARADWFGSALLSAAEIASWLEHSTAILTEFAARYRAASGFSNAARRPRAGEDSARHLLLDYRLLQMKNALVGSSLMSKSFPLQPATFDLDATAALFWAASAPVERAVQDIKSAGPRHRTPTTNELGHALERALHRQGEARKSASKLSSENRERVLGLLAKAARSSRGALAHQRLAAALIATNDFLAARSFIDQNIQRPLQARLPETPSRRGKARGNSGR